MSVYFFLPDYIGEETLSGGSACRWYLNEDIAAINDFFNKLGGEDVKVAWVPLDGDVSGGVKPIVEMQHKTVMELRELDPWDAEVVFFFLVHACIVRICSSLSSIYVSLLGCRVQAICAPVPWSSLFPTSHGGSRLVPSVIRLLIHMEQSTDVLGRVGPLPHHQSKMTFFFFFFMLVLPFPYRAADF